MEILEPIVENLRLPLEALTVMNVGYLRRNPHTPAIYESGVVWRMEGVNRCTGRPAEVFAPIPEVLEQGWGDCEDLAAWLAAQYRVRGYLRAYAFAVRSGAMIHPELGRVNLIHILVSRDGACAPSAIEDPSVVMGMPAIPRRVLLAAVREFCGVR